MGFFWGGVVTVVLLFSFCMFVCLFVFIWFNFLNFQLGLLQKKGRTWRDSERSRIGLGCII